jgi:hypothetical protein
MTFDLLDYLSSNGVGNLRENMSGESIQGSCPYPDHDDHNPSWSIYKKKPYRFVCWGCGKRGVLRDLKRDLGFVGRIPGEHDPLEKEGESDIKDLKARFDNLDNAVDSMVRVGLPKGFVRIDESKHKDDVFEYLDGRGVLQEILSKQNYYNIGTCSEFPGYIILPIYRDGLCLYWTGRSYKKDCDKRFRFINPTRDSNQLGKSGFLYAPYLPKQSRCGVVVEGQFDTIKLLSFGVNGVGTFNASPSASQIRQMVTMFDEVTLLYDNDLAGEIGVIKAVKMLKDMGIVTYSMVATKAEDAGAYEQKTDFLYDFKNRVML